MVAPWVAPLDSVGISCKAVLAGDKGDSRKLVVVTKNRRSPWRGFLIFSGVVLLATLSVMVFVPNDRVLLEVGSLLVGLAAGASFLRFGVPRQWMGSVVLVLFVVVWFVLGVSGYAWFGGFLSGALAGLAWGRAARSRTRVPAAPWTVDKRGFGSATEAWRVADEALHSLDGAKRGRLTVEYGSARFEVAGGVEAGMVCHRNAVAADDGSWVVLVHPAGRTDQSVEVPMGGLKGLMPLYLVHNLDSVERALADFFRNPTMSSFGPEWRTGDVAEATRLTGR